MDPVLSTDCNRTHRVLCQVIAQLQLRILPKTRELLPQRTIDPAILGQAKVTLTTAVQAIRPGISRKFEIAQLGGAAPITRKIEKRVQQEGDEFPWYVGFEDPQSVNGGVVFSADFPGFLPADRQSALHLLASKLVSGTGPHTLFMKTIESGLAYTNSVGSDPLQLEAILASSYSTITLTTYPTLLPS
jgi:hypothetical protein